MRIANRNVVGFAWLALALTMPGTAVAAPGKPDLKRKYRRGETVVYQTEVRSEATVRTQPAGLVAFLPPFPTQITTHQLNTVTVRAVHPDGGADVENRFDRFELHSNLAERSPKELREWAEQSQQNFSGRISGHTLLAHYDRQGRLTGFEGVDAMFQSTDVLLRKPIEEALRLVLEQMGGGLYRDRRTRGDEWSHKFSSPATAEEPWSLESESTWRYAGQTRYGRVRAAIVNLRFDDVLTPALGELSSATPLAQLAPPSPGVASNGLSIVVRGQGEGRLLAALDDGRILENQIQTRQTLTATLKSPSGPSGRATGAKPVPPSSPASAGPDPITIEISSQTILKMAASPEPSR